MNITKQTLHDLASKKQKEEQDLYAEQASVVLEKLLSVLEESANKGYFSYRVSVADIPKYLGKVLPTVKEYELIQGKLAEVLGKAPYNFTTTLQYEQQIIHLFIAWE
jgi:hypothetical protein